MVYSSREATRWFMRHVRELEPTADVGAHDGSLTLLPEEPLDLGDLEVSTVGRDRVTLEDFLRQTSTDGIMVLRQGRVVYERCFEGYAVADPHLCHSITKSLVSCVAGNLVARGVFALEDRVTDHVRELAGSAYGDATVRNLLDMTVDIRYTEDHEDEETEDARLDRICGVRPSRAPDEPGSAYDYATTMTGGGAHGDVLHYVSLNTDVLGWVMERASGVHVPELIRNEVWSKLGAQDDAYIALDGAGSAQADGGFCCSLRDLARFGLMLAQRGAVAGCTVVPQDWVDDIHAGGDLRAFAAAPDCVGLPRGWSYRSCFWIGAQGEETPFMGLGMYGQVLYVDIERQVVVAKFSSQEHAVDDAAVSRTYAVLNDLAHALTGESRQREERS